jgi:glycosyltransferase involved in cell wall biosynthesis
VSEPRISIVTPTLNRAQYLGEAIESVLAQGYANFEHIVVDGMSTDGTAGLLARYPHLRVIREPDTGLYDALNKGLRAATGEITGHLNSDDLYSPGAFSEVAAAFGDPQVDAVFGGAEIFTGDLREERRVVLRMVEREEIDLTFRNITVRNCITNARFFHRRVYEHVGFNDVRYRISSDRDFLMRVALSQPRAVLLERVVYQYRMHAGSLTINEDDPHSERMRDEFLAIAEEYLARSDLPAEARHCCVRWHERESAHAALRTLRAGDWPQFRNYARRGLRVRATWPVMFVRHLAGHFLKSHG